MGKFLKTMSPIYPYIAFSRSVNEDSTEVQYCLENQLQISLSQRLCIYSWDVFHHLRKRMTSNDGTGLKILFPFQKILLHVQYTRGLSGTCTPERSHFDEPQLQYDHKRLSFFTLFLHQDSNTFLGLGFAIIDLFSGLLLHRIQECEIGCAPAFWPGARMRYSTVQLTYLVFLIDILEFGGRTTRLAFFTYCIMLQLFRE